MGENLGPCVERIYPRHGFGHGYPCGKPGKVVVNKCCYCGLHDPDRLAATRIKNNEKGKKAASRMMAGWDVEKQAVILTAAARKAAHQEGSWDAVADAVTELERLEAVLASLP